MKNIINVLLATTCLLSLNTQAFENGDLISFDPGVPGCNDAFAHQCNPPNMPGTLSGSYIALDLNNNGTFEQFERIPLTVGYAGGLILGYTQGVQSIDQWSFFFTSGHHQTNTPVTHNPDGTLDFSGWEAIWGGNFISLGNGAPATVTCSDPLPCTIDDNYAIDYTTTINNGIFYGYRYKLHLSKGFDNAPALNVNLSVSGGNAQECNAIGGNTISLTASVTASGGAQLNYLEWTMDGSFIGYGTTISPFVSLGTHNISVKAVGVNGIQSSASTSVTIRDTTKPAITADFVDSRSGSVISTITAKNTSFVKVQMSASDICDSSPNISGIGGFSLIDGDLLKIQGNLDKVELITSTLKLNATSKDASGNPAAIEKVLSITP